MSGSPWSRVRTTLRAKYSLRLFASSLIILVFALCSGFITYSYAARLLRTETIRLNDMMLREIASGLDEKVSLASTHAISAACDPKVLNATYGDYRAGAISLTAYYDAYKRLSDLYQESFDDLFVYFAHSDRIISGIRAASERDLYTKVYYGQSVWTAELMDALLTRATKTYTFNLDGAYTVAVAQALPLDRLKDPNAIAVCVLKSTDITALVRNFASSEGFFMVLSGDERVILSTFSEPLGSVSLADVSSGLETVKIGGSSYLLQAHTSGQTQLTYVHALPAQVFWQRLQSLRYAAMLTMAIFFGLGMLAIGLLTKRNYKPIGTLVSDVTEQTDIAPSGVSGNEIAYLRQVLLSAMDERRRHSDALRERFVGRALFGLHDPHNDVQSEFQAYGVTLLSDRFTVFSMCLESAASDAPETYTYADESIRHAFDASMQAASVPFCGVLICHRPDLFSYLLNLPPDETVDVLQVARRFQSTLRDAYGLHCTLTCGECLPGWEGLAQSYTHSMELLEQRSIYGACSFIPIRTDAPPAFRYSFVCREATETAILSYIHTGKPLPEMILHQVKTACCDGEIRLPSEFQCYSHDLCTLAHKIVLHLGCPEACLKPLYDCDNLPDFDGCFARVLEELRRTHGGAQAQREEEAEAALCRNVMAYIEETLGDPALCLEEIGAHFGMSGSYISKRFKRLTGISIVSQIALTRVERARHLLADTDESVECLAARLGFLDSSAFIRVFKKATNLTPGMYRKLHQKLDGRQAAGEEER